MKFKTFVEKIIKKGDEFKEKRGNNYVIFQEIIKSPNGDISVMLKGSKNNKTKKIAKNVFYSSYETGNSVVA